MQPPRFNHSFFTNRPARPSFAQLQIGRLAFYPANIIAGEALLAVCGQGMILAAAPPLMHLVFFAALSACLLMPLFIGTKFLIDKYLSTSSSTHNASYVLLYLADILLNIKLMAYLWTMLNRPIMNVYALYSITGTGLFALVALGIIVSLIIQAYGADHSNRIDAPDDMPQNLERDENDYSPSLQI